MTYGREGMTIHASPPSCPHGHALASSSEWMGRCRFRVSSAQRFRVFSRRDNSRCFLSPLPLPRSSELASGPTLFFGNQTFHAFGDFFLFQHFTAIDLRQTFFDLADEPFVVTHQTLDCFMH